jgi:solute carrier family 39 (zinc transporter), member 9
MAGSGAIAVVSLAVVMFGASFSAGTVPLCISLNQERMSLISSLGVGLLLGTSLGVVLPEGIETLFPEDAQTHSLDGRQLQGNGDYGNVLSPTAANSHHVAIGLALVAGYLVMHLLTFLPPLLFVKDPEAPIPLASLPSTPRLERMSSSTSVVVETPKRMSNTTIGLCIHSLADGIALGSSALSNNFALEGIVFLAIMLHKVSSLL